MTTLDPDKTKSEKTAAVRSKEGKVATGGVRLALLAGLLLWLANPPATLWPLAWGAIAPLILSVTRPRYWRQAVWRGYLFGWAFLGPTWYWTGLTIVAWTHSPIGWVAWFGLTLILAGFYAVWGGFAWWISRRTTGGRRMLALAAGWVVMEWARTLGSLSMPWAQLSYTQYRFPLVLQIADLTGAYGVSFLMMLVNAGIALWFMERNEPSKARRLRGLFAGTMLTVFALFYGFARMTQPEEGRTITAAAMQGNFDNSKEFDLDLYSDLTRAAHQSAPASPPTLYVWSESAAPNDAVHDYRTRALFTRLSAEYRAAILVGSRVIDPGNAEANSAVLFVPDREAPLRYDKVQLVPFGEFIPFRPLFPASVSQAFGFFPTDVTPGQIGSVLRFPGVNVGQIELGPFICYESMYPDYARRMTQSGAHLLTTISNDSWFQSLAAMEQHLAAVVLRAVENRRDVVRATTTGITCFVNAKGQVTARALRNQSVFLVSEVRLRDSVSLYTRFGDWFVGACVLIVAGLFYQNRSRFLRR